MLSGAAGQVVITLTTMDDGWAVPLTNTSYGPSNTSHAQFLHDIGVWSKITQHLWIWDCARHQHPFCMFHVVVCILHAKHVLLFTVSTLLSGMSAGAWQTQPTSRTLSHRGLTVSLNN